MLLLPQFFRRKIDGILLWDFKRLNPRNKQGKQPGRLMKSDSPWDSEANFRNFQTNPDGEIDESKMELLGRVSKISEVRMRVGS